MEGFPKFIKPIATGLALMGAVQAGEVTSAHAFDGNKGKTTIQKTEKDFFNISKPEKAAGSFTVGVDEIPGSARENRGASQYVETININGSNAQMSEEENQNNSSTIDTNGNRTKISIGQQNN